MKRQSKYLVLIAAVAVAVSAGQFASAATITLANGGFNDGIPAYPGSGPFTEVNPVPGWSVATNEAGFARSTNEVGPIYPGPSEGTGYLTLYKNTWIYQQTSHQLTAGEIYTFALDIADYPDNVGWLHLQMSVGNTTEPESTTLTNHTIVNSLIEDVQWNTFDITYDTTDPGNTATVAAHAGELLWVRITAGPYQAGGNVWVYADNAQFTYVPEPVTIAWLGLGSLLVRRNRRS
jgi:hypothetical protein